MADLAAPAADATSPRAKILAAMQARQQQNPTASAASPAATPSTPALVAEGRKKFNTAVEDELLDYRHNHAQHIENCATTLVKIFSNILEHADEDKYRQIKATSNTLKVNVYILKCGEHLLELAGFKTLVVELQKYWVFDSAPGSTKFGILTEANTILQHALHTIHEKAERLGLEANKKGREEAQRKAVLVQIEDDKAKRAQAAEMRPVLVGLVAATELPAEAKKRAQAAHDAQVKAAGGRPGLVAMSPGGGIEGEEGEDE